MFMKCGILLVNFYHSKLNGNILLSASTQKKRTKSKISYVAFRIFKMLCRLDSLSEKICITMLRNIFISIHRFCVF